MKQQYFNHTLFLTNEKAKNRLFLSYVCLPLSFDQSLLFGLFEILVLAGGFPKLGHIEMVQWF